MQTTTDSNQLGGREITRIVYTEEDIRERIADLGREITAAYTPEDNLLVLGLLKGSVLFMADLVRAIHLPIHIDFMVASSYGNDKETSGDVRLLYDASASLKDRAVLVVEDIIDSGNTLKRLLPRLEARGPSRVDVVALLHKRLIELEREARWVGFDAPNEFLVGYGLDYAEDFRHLPYIASL